LVRDATLGLLSTAVRGLSDVPAPAPRHSQRALAIGRVRSFIEEHLTDPSLTPGKLCQALAVTRPTLYRAFESEGGVSSYIQRRRLEAAHACLSDEARKTSMAEIADEFCFSSPAHFSTAFRRQFGFAPREARRGTRSAGARALFETWQEALEDPGRSG
jgi:AraC-like DNA-binding protein